MSSYIVWRGTINRRLREFALAMNEKLEATMHAAAQEAEDYAKQNAPWKDETGAARNGLRGVAVAVPGKVYTVELSHSVPYGIYLETRWAAKYAIIEPTIRHMAPRVEAMVRSLI